MQIQSMRLNKHRKGSQLIGDTSGRSERTLISQRAYSNEEKSTRNRIEHNTDVQENDQDKLQLKMIKKELIQFQQDLQSINIGKKKRSIREFKDQVEVFMYAVRLLLTKAKDNEQSNQLNNEGECYQNSMETYQMLPQENSIWQQNEETSIMIKDQDRRILFGTSVKKESSKLSEEGGGGGDDQLAELSELLLILDECIQELNSLIEQKALCNEDQLGYIVREAEYVSQIEVFEQKMRILQDAKILEGMSFQDLNQDLKLQRHQNIVQYYQQYLDSTQSQINQLLQEINFQKNQQRSIVEEHSQFLHVNRELALMRDEFKIGDKWMINLFEIDFMLNIMDQKKNEVVVQTIVKIQNYFIQELDYLLEERSKGCFSIYESLLNVYDAENHNLVSAFGENPVLEFQQKLFLERQSKYNQLIQEKLIYIQDAQNNILSPFPKLRDFIDKLKSIENPLKLLMVQNKNNQNISVLFKLLHNHYKQKIQSHYTRVLDNMQKQSALSNSIERGQAQLKVLEDKAVIYKKKLLQFQIVEESLNQSNQDKYCSPNKTNLLTKFDILEDVKFNFQARKFSLTQKKQSVGDNVIDKKESEGFSFAEDRKNYIQSLLEEKSRQNSQHKKSSSSLERSPNNRSVLFSPNPKHISSPNNRSILSPNNRYIHSPNNRYLCSPNNNNNNNNNNNKYLLSPNNISTFSSRLEDQWSLTKAENHQEYQYEKVKKKCILLMELIMELDLKRQSNNITIEEIVLKEMKRMKEKEKFLASSIFRTLKLIKFKFEQINQQVSIQTLNSQRSENKINVEERDRIITQLFGEANLLCCDYEANFKNAYESNAIQNQKQVINSSSQSHNIVIKDQQHSNSASKLTSQNSTQNANKGQQKPILKKTEQNQNIRSNTPTIASTYNIGSQKSSPQKNKKNMSRCKSFVESQVQRIMSQQKCHSRQHQIQKQMHQYTCSNGNNINLQQNEIVQNISAYSIASQQNISYHNNMDQNYFIPSFNQYSHKLKPDYQTDSSSSPLYGSRNISNNSGFSNGSQQTQKQIGSAAVSNNISMNSIIQTNYQQEQQRNNNKNYSFEHQYISQKQDMLKSKNFKKKEDTVKIGQLFNQNASFISNTSLSQIKNLISSPNSQTNQSSFLSSNQTNKNNQSLVSNQNIISNNEQLIQKNVNEARNKSCHQSRVYLENEQVKHSQRQYNQLDQQQQQLQSNQTLQRTQSNLQQHYILQNSQPKYGVVSININQLANQSEESENVIIHTNSQNCSSIQSELPIITTSIPMINSTQNKNIQQNKLYHLDLDGEDYTKFSFNNQISNQYILNRTCQNQQSISIENKQNSFILNKENTIRMQDKKNNDNRDVLRNNQSSNKSNLSAYQNLCKDIFNNRKESQQLLSSPQDKENVNIQQINCSKEPKQMNQNSTHKKLNLLLQAATCDKVKQTDQQQINQNNQRAVASKYPQCKNPLSKDSSIYEGSSEVNTTLLDNSNYNVQQFNQKVNINTIQPSSNDIEQGMPVYVRFNSQILLKKLIFDPLTMTIKDAVHLGYVQRIMTFNKILNRIEFYREKNNLKLPVKNAVHTGNNYYSVCSPKNNQSNNCFNGVVLGTNISNKPQESNPLEKKRTLEKYFMVQQIKKIRIPSSTQNIYKIQNNSNNDNDNNNQFSRSLYLDQKQIQQQNNFLLFIDGKDSGLTELIVNSIQQYQTAYRCLSSILSPQIA